MKISRNAPCPCGSGKKYKRCCSSSETPALSIVDRGHKSGHNNEFESECLLEGLEEFLDEPPLQSAYDALLIIQQRFREQTLVKLPHVKKYKLARKMHQEIVDGMLDFYDQGKFEQTVDTNETDQYADDYRTGKRAIELIDCGFDLRTDLGVKTFFDIMIYKPAPNMNCITEVFIAKNRYRKPEKIELLQGMLNSTLGLFEVVKFEKDTAYVTLKHVFTGKKFRIVDIGLSGSTDPDQLYIYTRVIPYYDINFGTGLSLVFPKNDLFIRQFIAEEKKNYRSNGELARLLKLYKHLDSKWEVY